MRVNIKPRSGFLIVFACSAILLGFALYQQHVEYLDPCPLCVFQRVAFIWMGLFALLAVLHNPARTGKRVYGALVFGGAVFGASVAGRHIWMQHLPADRVPECGPGLNYMLQNFPLMEALKSVFKGSGSCAEQKWVFLGLSMPEWTLIWYVGLGLLILWALLRDGAT
ncbi:MAG: disulfide bond formation protein B [Lysobacterales bacterium]|jgi:disulfide bond formation protein DsbB